jgi:hypothetical protein
MKIVKGRHSMHVAVFCECQGIKSSLSPPINLINSVGQVIFASSFAEDLSVVYEKDESGSIMSTPVQLSNDIVIEIYDRLSNKLVTDIDV